MHLLRRLLYLPLSLTLLTMTCFGLRSFMPGDPVLQQLDTQDARLANRSPDAFDRSYHRAATRLGLDRPLFYWSVFNASLPDTMHRIARPQERAMLKALTLDTGDWEQVTEYRKQLRELAFSRQNEAGAAEEARLSASRLLFQDDPGKIRENIDFLSQRNLAPKLVAAYKTLYADDKSGRLPGLKFRWNGTQNQYHAWVKNILSGDFGTSYIDQQPVATKIANALPLTLLLNGLAILLVFLVSIPLGLYLARRAGKMEDRIISFLLFLLFGVPSFWAATMLATFLTTPAYGLDLFPSIGIGEVEASASWWAAFSTHASHLILPVFCLAYPAWAYVSRQLKDSALVELRKTYANTARMRGLSERQLLWRHIFRNASFPLVTILGTLFPGMLAGSILIERIFNLPGMGQLLFTAAVGSDWPVVIILVLINGVLTAVGLLVADLAYAMVDPRVRLAHQSLRKPTLS